MALNPNRNYAATAGTRAGAEIDEGLRAYMLRVYNYMALGVAGTGVLTLFMATQPELMYTLAVGPMKWVLFIALIGMGWFSPKIITMKSMMAAQAYYWVYCALWGVMISPFIYMFMQSPEGVMDIARAFFITAGMFAGASLFGYVTKRDLAPMAKFMMMAIIGIIIASTGFGLLLSIGVVLLFAGMTAWETQDIKNMYAEHYGQDAVAKMAVFGALRLYGNFIVMFIHILSILGIMRGE
jgi:hypothetical protein